MFALKVFLCVLVLTVVSDAQTTCTNTQTIANPSNLPSGALTLKVTAPSTTKFQLIKGSAWSIKVLQNATHLKATSAYSTSSGFTLTFTSSETNGISPSSLSSPFIIVLSILSGLMAMKSSSGADMRFVFLILGLSLIPFVLSASELDCTNGTVIITYPSGSSVTVNGIGATGCVDTNGYFTLVQNGNQCWGSGGSACATPSGCCGCCASGLQCGGSAQYDNQYWIGCRPTGTSGGITNATCNAVSSSGGTTTAAPTTTPHSGTTTAAPVGNKKLYCPSSNDLVAAYGSPSITNRGWSITGGAAVATKASYNLIGGWVSYTANWASVPTGVNANIYSVSPNFGGASSFTNAQYCDGQAATSTKPWCVEIDWIESNGNCGGQTTLHTSNINGNGNSGATNVCGTSGCLNNYAYSGTASFPMNVSFTSAGVWNVVWNGHTIGGSSVTPAAGSGDWAALLNAYTQLGAVIYSSQWTGWVPTPGSCSSTQGNLAAATFSISNLQIYGSVVQGPTPTSC